MEVQIMGYFTFLPKYFEYHFGTTVSMASILTGKMENVDLQELLDFVIITKSQNCLHKLLLLWECS